MRFKWALTRGNRFGGAKGMDAMVGSRRCAVRCGRFAFVDSLVRYYYSKEK
jgi:hypothetical protein